MSEIPSTMRAVRVHATGGAEALRTESVPVPRPGPGDVLVRVGAAGVNFIDVYKRSGLYGLPLPGTLGEEGAGTVVALGSDVAGLREGERVAWASVTGAYAEYAVVPAARLVPLPEGVSVEQGAAVMLQGMTAHYLATSTRPLGPGDRCLVHAAAGGVGLLLVQIAKMRGAFVIGTAGSDEKVRLAREAGADETIVYTRQDFVAETRRITGGEGVHVIYDSVGQATFLPGLDLLVPRGMMVLFGQSSGPVPPFDPQILNRKGSLFLTRPSLGHYVATRGELLARARDLFAWIAAGKLTVRVGAEFELADAAGAHRALEGRRTTGKVLLRVGG
ncbi:MAG TPA: quinone oxidoreductase [Gemmatimonadaceae bacterium]|nr:quinone oxidoreductase [Gemmatimonadaceae bacterium]